MTTGPDEQSNDDILAEILDEFMNVVRSGSVPDVEEVVTRFPHLEEQIRELLPLVSLVEEVHPKPPDVAVALNDAPVQLGPYRIISEIGRGGMGVVYRAVHAGLGRQVALKVLPKSLVGDEDHKTRFLREASAAASLHHTNIVPVFEVGEDGDTCFYAMQFIEGTGLNVVRNRLRDAASNGNAKSGAKESSAITRLQASMGVELLSGSASSSASSKRPYFESVARVGVQVADALQYAHSRGIIHRDVKPGNLILDPAGVVWLTDFGLAKTDDIDLTATGQVVGTTRYVSPERFRGECTALSDVYALGATLYELLTLRSAFDARDHLQLIDQIVSKEPPRLRDIDRRIPRDLETIVLKALEKEPRRRYQSAFEMMEDLRRFCAGEPVKARSVTAFERGLKWARRRPAVTALGVLLFLVGTVGFTVSSVKWAEAVRERDKKAAAQKLAEANLVKARDAVQRMLTHVGDVRLSNIPHMEKLRAQLLQEALAFNLGFVTDSDEPDVLSEVGLAHGRLGDIHLMLAEPEKALSAFEEAQSIFASLYNKDPENSKYLINQAASLSNCALARMSMGHLVAAEADCEKAIAAAHKVLKNNPNDDDGVSQLFTSSVRLANIREHSGRLEDAVTAMRAALKVFEKLSASAQKTEDNRKQLVQANTMLASSLLQIDDTVEAKSVLERAIAVAKKLVAEFPDAREYRDSLGNAAQMQYAVLRKLGEREQARELIQQATVTFADLARDFPHFTEYKNKHSNSAIGLAISYAEAGDHRKAEPSFLQGVQIAKEVANAFPSDVGFQEQAAGATRMTGIFFQNSRQLDKAEEFLLDAHRQLEILANNAPDNPKFRLDMAKTAHALGTNFRAKSDIEEAINWTRRAIELEESVLVEMNEIPIVRHKLCQEYRQLGELLLQEESYAEALQHLQKAVEIERDVVTDAPENVEHHRHLAIALHKLADWYSQKEMPESALPLLEESIAIRVRLSKDQPLWFNPQVELPSAYRELALALMKLDRRDEALSNYEKSLAVCERLMPEHETDLNLREEFARCLEFKMRWLVSAEQGKEAVRIGQKALDVRNKTLQMAPEDNHFQSALEELKREVMAIDDT